MVSHFFHLMHLSVVVLRHVMPTQLGFGYPNFFTVFILFIIHQMYSSIINHTSKKCILHFPLLLVSSIYCRMKLVCNSSYARTHNALLHISARGDVQLHTVLLKCLVEYQFFLQLVILAFEK